MASNHKSVFNIGLLATLAACFLVSSCANPPMRETKFPPSPVNYTDSTKILKAAADAGDVKAMYILSRKIGDLPTKEHQQYLIRAANADYNEAQIDLSHSYQKGYDVNYAKAVYWAQRATCQPGGRHTFSEYLAVLYGQLEGSWVTPEERAQVKPNIVLAHMHASMVSLKIFGRQVLREELETRMTDEQIENSKMLKRQFLYGKQCPYIFKDEKLVALAIEHPAP